MIWNPVLAVLALAGAAYAGEVAKGPLRVLESNPRYFTDGSGKAIYLAGSHNWNNFQDSGHRRPETTDPPPVFDYNGYLDFLAAHHHNFFRLWRWEIPKWYDSEPPGIKYATPHPWVRSGPGMAADGKPKFDLTQLDEAYFRRMRERVMAARDRGIYVSIMLFDGYGVQGDKSWPSHPFNPANNINGIDADANRERQKALFQTLPGHDKSGLALYTLQEDAMGERVLQLQETYVRKIVDTVNDLDNVLYEICNEAGSYSTEWQYHLIRLIKEHEAHKPSRHPVGMTVQWYVGNNGTLFDSPADWISPNAGDAANSYRDNPPSAYRGKVVVNDVDHLWGHSAGDIVWVWKSFCRGLNVLLMEELLPSPTWLDSAREGMRQTREASEKIDLAHMTPHDELSSSKYCLARPGVEYLVFQPNAARIELDLRTAAGEFSLEWLDVNTGKTVSVQPVRGGEKITFSPPVAGPAVAHLKAETVK